MVSEMATGLELFMAAKNEAPPVGMGNEELGEMPTRRVGSVIERQHDA